MDRLKSFFRRTPPRAVPQCDFDAAGRCVLVLNHPSPWHRNAQGLEWYGVNFDRPSDVSVSSHGS
jgi:hypothetical protein